MFADFLTLRQQRGAMWFMPMAIRINAALSLIRCWDYDIHSGRTRTESADRVIDFVKKKGLEVQWVLETHIHADHLTGSAYIKEKLGGKSRHQQAHLKSAGNLGANLSQRS
jgi:glyoxylase-like metal-dependent hydrolase (beta-lactamase superfamily II)